MDMILCVIACTVRRHTCEEPEGRRSNLLANFGIAHLHCTKRSAVQVSPQKTRLAMTKNNFLVYP